MHAVRSVRPALGVAVALLAAVASLAFADPAHATGSNGTVYVLSNQTSGNAVIEYLRAADGTLTPGGSYATGGLGTGGGLGSQGAVVVDDSGRYLYAVNAGSDTVTSFRVLPRQGLEYVDTVASGGGRPTSVDVAGDRLYVLNAGGDGNVSGFTVTAGDLTPLPDSTRPLSTTNSAPAQVSVTPDGAQLVVTERATNRITLFALDADGVPSAPVAIPASGTTPFGFDFDNKGHLLVSEAFAGQAEASAASSYTVTAGGLSVVSGSVPTTETAACWLVVTTNGRYAYTGNAGTNSISGYRVAPDGSLTLLTPGGKTASTPAGVTDLALSRDSRFLYVRLGNGTVGAFAVGADGALTDLPAASGLPAGAAGMAAR